MELDLSKAVTLAVENNLNLEKIQIDLAASGFSEKNLWSEIFPTISANARAGYANSFFSNIAPPGGGGSSYRIGFGINLGLNAGIPYSMRSIRLAHQGNILRYEDAYNQLSILVTKRFYSLITEKNNLLLLEEILNLSQRHYERNQVAFRNGLIRELSVIQSRLAFENARYSLSAASIAYENNKGEFLALLGMPEDTPFTLLGEINIIRIIANSEELINQYLGGRPDIVRARQEIERMEFSERQLIMQSRAPSLGLSAEWTSSAFDPFSDNISSSATLTIPIDSWIPGTSRGQAVRRSGDSVEKAKLDLTITEDAARNQIRSLAAVLRNSWNNIEIARLTLEVAHRNYELTEEGFRNGTVEYLILEEARNNMADARQRLLQTELFYLTMILDLSAAINIDWKILIQKYGVPSE
jgi:multidrug efflux system outer membrane protein